jgi:DNA-binding Xre family transcriptional regulator
MRAYDEKYVSAAAVTLADMFDYALNDCGEDADLFYHMFITTGAARSFERGDPTYLAGKGGIEIAMEVLTAAAGRRDFPVPRFRDNRSPEYWAGWALAQYQWSTARPFAEIRRFFPFPEIIRSYHPLHEADISKFIEVAEARAAADPVTNLSRRRGTTGLSQAQLSARSGVGLRSIQMYEQRRKDINNAAAMTLARLARALSCGVEDLLEFGATE